MCSVMRSSRCASKPAPSGSTFMCFPPCVVLTGVLAHLGSSRPAAPHRRTPGGSMTDVLDRLDEPSPSLAEPAPPRRVARDDLRPRIAIAALSTGAAAIHLAMAPGHVGEWALEGGAFIAAAWAQLLVAVLAIARPKKWVWWFAVASNAAFVAAWAV